MITEKDISSVVIYGRGKGRKLAYSCLVYCYDDDKNFRFSGVRYEYAYELGCVRSALLQLEEIIDEPICFEDSRVFSFYRTARNFRELDSPERWKVAQ